MNSVQDQTPQGTSLEDKHIEDTPAAVSDKKKKKKKKPAVKKGDVKNPDAKKGDTKKPAAKKGDTKKPAAKKKKMPAHVALLKKKMEEEAELIRKLEEEEAEKEKEFQRLEDERLANEIVNREKKRINRAKQKERKKERDALQKREDTFRRLGLDPSNPLPIKKPRYGKRKPKVPEPEITKTADEDKADEDKVDEDKADEDKADEDVPDEDKADEDKVDEDVPDDWESMADTDIREIPDKTSTSTSTPIPAPEEIQKPEAEPEKVIETLKAPICCVLGGVDSGKTTFIDKIKHTSVQEGEAGGITQKISAIWINNKSPKYNIPGILILDTPGHDSFHNLRHLGASVCNMVILMVDILEDIKSQTIKAIQLIKDKKIPFIIILNKLDRLFDWQSGPPNQKVKEILNQQSQGTKNHFEKRVADIRTRMMEQGLNVDLHYENKDFKKVISMVPVSSHTAEGITEVLNLILKLSTKYLDKNLIFEEKKVGGIILGTEVVKGFGNCINIILSNGRLNPNDTLVLESVNGALESQVHKLIVPTGKKQYDIRKEACGTINVKVVLQKDIDMNSLIIGSHLHIIPEHLEKKEFLDTITSKIENEMKALERNVSSYGISLHSRTYGALEALTDYLEEHNMPYFKTKIGKVKKIDLIACQNTNQYRKDNHYNILVAFDTEFEFDLKKVPTNTIILTGNIIYRLFEGIDKHVAESKRNLLEKQRQTTVYPVKVKLISEQHIFASRNPMLLGVKVLEGELRIGTPLMVMKDTGPMRIGSVRGIRGDKDKELQEAGPEMEVPVKIEADLGHVIRQIGRDFDSNLTIYSHLDENSSYNLRQYFWESMTDKERLLVVEMEKMLGLD